jgi:MYXO-CTERM domain-containing protein
MGAGADEALKLAVDTWQAALPGWLILELDYSLQRDEEHTGETCHTRDGYDPDQGSENRNVVRFAKHGEPTANGALAITVLTYDAQGRILDADIAINGVYRFGDAANPTCPRKSKKAHSPQGFGGPIDPSCTLGCHGDFHLYDLQSILTHELGHLLGLREDYDNEQASMYAYSWPGEVHKRDLADSDIDALWAIYDDEAQDGTSAPGCSGASVAGEPTAPQGWVLLGIALGFIAGRRRPGGVSARSNDGSIGST